MDRNDRVHHDVHAVPVVVQEEEGVGRLHHNLNRHPSQRGTGNNAYQVHEPNRADLQVLEEVAGEHQEAEVEVDDDEDLTNNRCNNHRNSED